MLLSFAGGLEPVRVVRRVNRFAVRVDRHGAPALAHLPNSGRLNELLRPGTPGLLRASTDPARRTCGDLVLVQAAGRDRTGWVSVDARLPGRLALRILELGLLARAPRLSELRQEVCFRQSRLDLAGTESGTGRPFWGEAKSVTLVQEGVALFPDAPTDRGRRHLEELIEARRIGALAMVLFVILRDDARAFAPYAANDPAFARTLRRAHEAGVQVRAAACSVSPEGVRWLRELPARVAGAKG
ncbi:DNA/RNA nuclease SfsA [Limnochorda pilosa]|uniref:Sugar fermentation stimulation protein homolog n=1 Tax=Limnochorda pilosa TaxID=1555112 RepID=A0A0K2SJN0_LIMPI|nr:DNA/RNA nuclease SfsA [Limnochorda pilosa]BAS27300.1 sugar fermentation stimulation protein [Limnochorda pilosa]